MSITRNFNLYLNAGKSIPPVINVNQYDQGESWVFTLYNDQGIKYVPSDGSIIGVKSDGNLIANVATVNASGQVVVTETEQMTASAGRAIYELSIDGGTHGTANFVVLVEKSPSDGGTPSASDLSLFREAIDSVNPTVIANEVGEWLTANLATPSTPPIDKSLSVSNAAADAKVVGDFLNLFGTITDLTSQYLTNGYIPLAVSVGTTINTDSPTSSNQRNYIVVLCKKGDVFTITGTGGANPRLWGFLDTDKKLLSVAQAELVATNLVLVAESDGYFVSNVYKNSTYSLSMKRYEVGLATVIKDALLQLASKVAYIDGDGQTYYDALYNALYPPTNLVSISAVYTQSGTIYETDSLDDLKPDLVVTATYDDTSTDTVTAYILSGSLTVGTSTITVSYGGKTTTFTVTVSAPLLPTGYTAVDYISSNVNGTPSAAALTSTPYIKTGFPSSDTDILNYTVKLVYECNFNTVTAIPVGGRNGDSNSNTTRGLAVNLGSTDTVINFGNTTGQTALIRSATGSAISLNQKHTLIFKNGNISLDGTTIVQTGATSAVQVSTYKWGLFGRNNKGSWTATTSGGDLSPMIGKIYEFSIKNESDVDVLNYIPCKRNSDNKYGMYDTVSSTFYTSAIATGFTGGND